MADEWLDEVDETGAQTGAGFDDGDEADVRYGLTALGALSLADGRAFAGFGPCAVFAPPIEGAPARARRAARSRRRTTPLFG